MIALLTEIKSRIETILTGQEFADPAGGLSVPMVKIGALDPKRSGSENDEDFPFVVVRPMSGSADPREGRFVVQLVAGVWVDETEVVYGFVSIDRMLELLLGLTSARGFDPYRLSLPATWELGSDGGQQQHPYYFVTITLSFVQSGSC